jgi:SPX domain protein involved in polyphosphate accumulation
MMAELCVHIDRLREFALLNYLAVLKLVKKHAKWSKSNSIKASRDHSPRVCWNAALSKIKISTGQKSEFSACKMKMNVRTASHLRMNEHFLVPVYLILAYNSGYLPRTG